MFGLNMIKRGVKMNIRRAERQVCLTLPEPRVEILGVHAAPGRIEYDISDGRVKLWDRWKVQIVYQSVDENGVVTEKQFQETVLWEDQFSENLTVDGERPPTYQTLPYCVKIATASSGSGSRLTLDMVAATAFEPGMENLQKERKERKDLVANALKRLGLTEPVKI
jgi:hypothetical protein